MIYRKRGVMVLMFVLVFIHFGSAAHYISGYVNDAIDGENANGKEVSLWNSDVGITDNVSDIVGATGNSGVSGVYLIDCEMLSVGCAVNDVLSLKIFGDRYISWIVNVTVSGAGYDAVENLSLNTPPDVTLVSPVDSGYASGSVDFNCSFFDYDDNIESVSLWGNWSGSWIEEDSVTSGFENGYVVFNENLIQGDYLWNCFVEDDLDIGSFNESNNSFFVDTTNPSVWGINSVNEVCGLGSIPVDCNISDNIEVENVTIRSISPSNALVNYSANWVSGNIYRANVDLNEVGNWTFECFGFDEVGNENYSIGDAVKVASGNPELGFIGGVAFNKDPVVEGEVLNISVNISNIGCVASGDFVVGFFKDNISFENKTVSLSSGEFLNVSVLWETEIGMSEIFVYADLNEIIDEDSELNNSVNGSVYLKAWQGIYGNLSLDKMLGAGHVNMSFWLGEDSFAGSVFVADSESEIEWGKLQAIGRTKTGDTSSNDFSEIDFRLGMSFYNDSISESYAHSGLDNFSIFQTSIADVPYINASDNGNFVTGILWDMDDSLDTEYDSSEGEDVIFVTKVNRGAVGNYGVYDYEISIPSKLRSYDEADESIVYLYYDLN